MPDWTWVVTTVIAGVAAVAALARWWVERQRSDVLRDQLGIAENQLAFAKRSTDPDPQIVDLHPTGGGSAIHFSLYIQNRGARPVRSAVAARVGDRIVHESEHDLLANAAPTLVILQIPRPELGELMRECGHATTLYGQSLKVSLAAESAHDEREWREEYYDETTDSARYQIQQRYWRRGRGETTEGRPSV